MDLTGSFLVFVGIVTSSGGFTLKSTEDGTPVKSHLTSPQANISKILQCSSVFHEVGDHCLFVDNNIFGTWDDMRSICINLGGDLANLKDANFLADISDYLEYQGLDTSSYWVGSNDKAAEGQWVWVNDNSEVKMGTPLWGDLADRKQEPTGSSIENCGVLLSEDHFYMHDTVCDYSHTLMCEQFTNGGQPKEADIIAISNSTPHQSRTFLRSSSPTATRLTAKQTISTESTIGPSTTTKDTSTFKATTNTPFSTLTGSSTTSEDTSTFFKTTTAPFSTITRSSTTTAITNTPYQTTTYSPTTSILPPVFCPPPYEAVGQVCLFINTLNHNTWDNHKTSCESLAGHMIKIDDANFLGILFDYLNAIDIHFDFWIGATDEHEEGYWQWHDSASVRNGTPFWGDRGDLQQSPDGGYSENCAVISTSDHYFFDDRDCDDMNYVICQIDEE